MSKSDFHILRFSSLESTNSYAINSIQTFQHNTVIVADKQTRGRGRLERNWVSESDENIYASIVIRPDINYRKLPLVNFTQLFSVVVSMVLSDYGLDPAIKWPNDILIDRRKICGILSEVSFRGSLFQGIVVGIGINIGSSPQLTSDRLQDTTSLFDEAGNKFPKQEVLDRILDTYLELYNRFIEEGFSGIHDLYMRYFPHIGENISIINGSQDVSGIVRGISGSGELIIEDKSGKSHKITLGDMIWRTCQLA